MLLLSALAGAGGSGIADARASWCGRAGELWEHLLLPPVTVLEHVT